MYKNIVGLVSSIYDYLSNKRRAGLAVKVLSCFMVFIVTYMLILPAFTLDKKDAAEQGGIDMHATDPLTYEGDGYVVTVDDKTSVLPEDTEVVAEEITADADSELYDALYDEALQAVRDEAAGQSAGKSAGEDADISYALFYDISLVSEGEAIEPGKAVDVTISYDKAMRAGMPAVDPEAVRIIHWAEDKSTGKITTEVLRGDDVETRTVGSRLADTTFEAESFSIYAVVYTVDFHFDVDGRTYDFSIPGGGYLSLAELAEVLGIANTYNSTDGRSDEAADETIDSDAMSIPLTLGDMDISEDTWRLIEDVENVTFSNPSLLSVSKADQDTTVGAIKDRLGLTCEYSAEMTDEEIQEIDAQTVAAGDWVLISLLPFTSDETLTVTMKNGEQFTVRVTDAQYDVHFRTNDISAGNFQSKYFGTDSNNGLYGTSFDGKSKSSDAPTLNYGVSPKPAAGYRFVFFVKNDSETLPGLSNTTLVSENTTFDAYFAPQGQYLVRYKVGEHGTISGSRSFESYSETKFFSYSGSIGATAIPAAGYQFAGWYDETNTLVASEATLPAGAVMRDCVLTAKFELIPAYTITYQVDTRSVGCYVYLNGTTDTKNESISETVVQGDEPIGATAVKRDNGSWKFYGWTDSDGIILSTDVTFVPYIDK